MGDTRAIHFDVYFDNPSEFDMTIDFGTYSLMVYYAKQLNYEKAKLLYDATLSEYYYRATYNKPLDDLTDEYSSHFNSDEIQQVIDFIENDLIPELNNEKQDLIEKYGGREGFYDRFEKDEGFIRGFIYEDEWYYSDPLQISSLLDAFKSLLSHVIFINQAYRVSIR